MNRIDILTTAARAATDKLRAATKQRKDYEAANPGASNMILAALLIHEGKCRARRNRLAELLGRAYLGRNR